MIQAIFPMTFLMIFLTTGFQPKAQIESGMLKTVIEANPAEHVLGPMRDLMLNGDDWGGIGIAALVIVGLGLLGAASHRPQLPLGLSVTLVSIKEGLQVVATLI